MLMPSIFGENLFDDFFDDYFPFDTDKELHKAEKKLYGRRAGHVMKTDIKEKEPENISVKNVMQVPAHVASMWVRK